MNKISLISLIVLISVGTVFAQGNADGDLGRNMEEIRGKISELKDVITGDYEILLAENQEAQGTITLSFSIAPDGSVLEPLVECSEVLSPLHEPVLEALKNLEFRPEEDQQEDIPVTIPISLLPPE